MRRSLQILMGYLISNDDLKCDISIMKGGSGLCTALVQASRGEGGSSMFWIVDIWTVVADLVV